MLARHVLGGLGWRALLLLWSAFAPLAVLAVWLLSWTLALRCDRAESGELRCTARSESFLGANEHSAVLRDVLAVRAGAGGVVFETTSGDVVVPLPGAGLAAAEDWEEIAAKLEALSRQTGPGSLTATARTNVVWRMAAGLALLLGLLTLWARGRSTVVSVDRRARTVTTQRRLYGLTLTEASLQLDEVKDVVTRRQGRFTRVLLRTRHGDVLLDRVPERREVDAVAALRCVLFE